MSDWNPMSSAPTDGRWVRLRLKAARGPNYTYESGGLWRYDVGEWWCSRSGDYTPADYGAVPIAWCESTTASSKHPWRGDS